VIGVAVLASSPMARARLEALVARSGWRLVPPPVAAGEGDSTAADVRADVLLMDPGARPAEALLRALPRGARLPSIVLLGADVAPATFPRLLRSGVRAILPRDASGPELAAGIEAVVAGLVVLHPSAAPAAVSKATAHRRPAEIPTDPLTPRELEILAMMAEGMRNRAIAQRLGISTHTVKFHIAAILDKLNARSRTEAVTIGLRQGLLMV
jgi:two-component system, NarL family, response regulator YdfI